MRERPARVPAVAGSRAVGAVERRGRLEAQDDGPPGVAGERPVAREDPGDRGADRRARAEDRDLAADVEAVAGREPLGDEGVRRAERGRRRAADDVEVADAALARQVDAEDGDRLGRGRPSGTGGQERAPFGRRGGQGHARDGLDRRERPIAETCLGERADPQVRAPDAGVCLALHGCLEARVDGEGRHEHGDADRDAERREQRARGPGDEVAPGVRDESAHGWGGRAAYRPSCASRAMSGAARWSSRRPSSISSRMVPSPMTRTRSA